MPANTANFLNSDFTAIAANSFILQFGKGAILLILILYAIFALIIIRQVDLMSKTLVTGISPLVKAFAILHAGVSVALIILAWGIL